MKRSLMKAAVVGLSMLCGSGMVLAQSKGDFGKREFDSNCAACHGSKGRGDGPYNPFLMQRTSSDLTVLTKNNNGVFPYERLYQVIDGRQAVAQHGPRDMPIWGADYLAQAAGYYMDVPYDPEWYVRMRIIALLDYINRMQMK